MAARGTGGRGERPYARSGEGAATAATAAASCSRCARRALRRTLANVVTGLSALLLSLESLSPTLLLMILPLPLMLPLPTAAGGGWPAWLSSGRFSLRTLFLREIAFAAASDLPSSVERPIFSVDDERGPADKLDAKRDYWEPTSDCRSGRYRAQGQRGRDDIDRTHRRLRR